MDGCRFAVNSDMKQYLEEKPGMFTDVEKLTKKDMEEEFFYVGLRMTAGVSLPEFERRFGCPRRTSIRGSWKCLWRKKRQYFRATGSF